MDGKSWKDCCDELHVITRGGQEMEKIIKCVGPINGNYEAAEKVRKFMAEKTMLAKGWSWNGQWKSEGGTSYAQFLRIRNACVPDLQVACNKDKTGEKNSRRRKNISGTYRAKGVFAGHIIYEKTHEDTNNMWWSLRFDAANKRWIFRYDDSKIVIGKKKYGETIEDYSFEPGEFIVKIVFFYLKSPLFCDLKVLKLGRECNYLIFYYVLEYKPNETAIHWKDEQDCSFEIVPLHQTTSVTINHGHIVDSITVNGSRLGSSPGGNKASFELDFNEEIIYVSAKRVRNIFFQIYVYRLSIDFGPLICLLKFSIT